MTTREPAANEETLRSHVPPTHHDAPTTAEPSLPAAARSRHPSRWLDRGGIRTRILVWYLVLLTLSIVIAIVGLRQILVTRLTADIDASLAQFDREPRYRAQADRRGAEGDPEAKGRSEGDREARQAGGGTG